jgi:integrase
MAIASILDYVSAQNGNHEVLVVPDNFSVERTVQRAVASPLPALTPRATVPATKPDPHAHRSQITLNELVARYRRESGHLAASTRKKMEFHFTVAARHLDFELEVTTFNAAQLRELKSKLCEGRKAASVNDIIFKGLGPLFKMAVDDGFIERSPLERVPKVKMREPERKNLSWTQAQQIEIEVGRYAVETGIIVGLIRNFGVGQAEIRHLLGEHVEVEKGVIHFRRKKTGKPFDVPIFPHAKELIEQLKSQGRLRQGKPVVSWRNPRKALESACDRLGVERFEPRAFRRSFIVHALESDVEPRVIAHWQGHKDANLIFRVYGKFIDAPHEQRQAEKMTGSNSGTSVTGI